MKTKLLLLIVLGLFLIVVFYNLHKTLSTKIPPTYGCSSCSLSSEDSLLISLKYRSKIKVDEIINTNVKEPISSIYFDSIYHLAIYKIKSIPGSVSLRNSIHLYLENASLSYDHLYRQLNNLPFIFYYNEDLINPSVNVILTLNGSLLKPAVRNDSIVSMNLSCNNFSMRYSDTIESHFNDAVIDILFQAHKKYLGLVTESIPLDILFLKRNKYVYFLSLTADNLNTYLPSDLLYNIVMGK